MSGRRYALDDFACPDPREFVDAAYRAILGRPPTAAEARTTVESLLTGTTRTYFLGRLRYGPEGEALHVEIAGLRPRYLAQRLARIPVLGAVVEWAVAVLRLPRTLRYVRGAVESQAVHRALLEQRICETDDRSHARFDAHTRQFAELVPAIEQRIGALEPRLDALTSQAHDSEAHLHDVEDRARVTAARLDAIHPPPLGATLAVSGERLVAEAKARAGIAEAIALASLSAHARYALFETLFYDSRAVAAKQRVYIDYLDAARASGGPFVDLGCGRGEFLRILREVGLDPIGVDVNADTLAPLRSDGFEVVEQDLLTFLSGETRMFAGASVLQVAEHLTTTDIERMLALLAARLVPGATLIVETPNPLSPFALGVFHTDPTHISPIPPERMRYAIEAAGFEQTLTLFQAKIPAGQFAGPDPRAWYADYAIIARRCAT